MPSKTRDETRRLIAAAAALRVAGASWEAVAERLGRSIHTCRNWPSKAKFRSIWRELYAAAEKEYMAEVATEARAILRSQLREKSIAAKRDAAKAILAHADRNRPSNSQDDPQSPWQFAESIPDHEANELEADNNAILGPDTTGGANGASGRALPG
jgi:transposase